MGYYPGEEINVKEFGPTHAIPVSFMILFGGKAGANYNFSFDLTTPSGKSVGKVGSMITKFPNRGVVQIVKLLNIPLLELGTWNINIKLDDKSYPRILRFTNVLAYFSN